MIFYANSLNQIKPDIIMSGLALRPRHAQIQIGGGGGGGGGAEGVQRTPSEISLKHSFFSNWSGPLKNHKATFLFMANIGTLAKRHLNAVSLASRFAGEPMMARLQLYLDSLSPH